MASNTSEPRTRWREKTPGELEDFYWSEIAPEMKTDGYNPDEEWPTYQWLVDNDFRGFEDAVSNHGYSLVGFFVDVVDLPEPDYEWGFSHEPTKQEFLAFLNALENRKNRKQTTLRSKRSRLSKYAQVYENVHGTSDLLAPAAEDASREEEYQNAVAVFEELENEFPSDLTMKKCHSDINQFYNFLNRWFKADWNPVENIPKDFDWSAQATDGTVALDADDVRKLVRGTDWETEYLMIVALSAWGLRPNEVASLHFSQINGLLEDSGSEYPYIEFDYNRKNGPGSVTMLFGADTVKQRVVNQPHEEWNGYLFPSSRSESGHVSTKTIQNWFRDLVERVELTVDGEYPTPKMGRRFWYSTYSEAMEEVANQEEIVADEQGSESVAVMVENYFDDEALRRRGRQSMKDALAEAFDGEPGFRQ